MVFTYFIKLSPPKRNLFINFYYTTLYLLTNHRARLYHLFYETVYHLSASGYVSSFRRA